MESTQRTKLTVTRKQVTLPVLHGKLNEAQMLIECQGNPLECPIWDHQTSKLYWVDIDGKKLYALDWNQNDTLEIVDFPEKLAAVALCKSGTRLLCAMESTLAFYYVASNELELLPSQWSNKCEPGANMRLNDGRCDQQGRFIVGGINFTAPTSMYSVTYAEGKLDAQAMYQVDQHLCSNSTCFSNDGATLFNCCSKDQKIKRYPYDQLTGKVTGPATVFHDGSGEGNPLPDGSIVNSRNELWNAKWLGSCLELYDTTNSDQAKKLLTVSLPVKRVTCGSLGGPNLDLLFITTCVGEGEEHSGCLYVAKVETPGLPECRFDDTK